jgi:SAM-dependent methyltransferase
MYLTDDQTYDNPEKSPYRPLFSEIVAEARRHGLTDILEVGCGSGTLARMLIEGGVKTYAGFDIAAEGVRKAKLRTPALNVDVGDATDPAQYARPYGAIVCAEVLEHIEDDLKVMALWRTGTPLICSVPNFDYDTHVRFFRHESEVYARYGKLVDFTRVTRITKPILRGLTPRQYFRRLRWSRDNPRAFLGHLGINAFDWHGGWFVFTGTRVDRSAVDSNGRVSSTRASPSS